MTIPSGAVGICNAWISLACATSNANLILQSVTLNLRTVGSGSFGNTPFGTFTVTASPLRPMLLANSQSSSTYYPTALGMLMTNTSAINYLSGNSVTAVLPEGDPGEYCGMDPSVMEQFYGVRSDYFATGSYACASCMNEAIKGPVKNINLPSQFTGQAIIVLNELPTPVAGAYSARIMCGAIFDVITESQSLKPVNTRYAPDVISVISQLFVPQSLVCENPKHLVTVSARIGKAMLAWLTKNMTSKKALHKWPHVAGVMLQNEPHVPKGRKHPKK